MEMVDPTQTIEDKMVILLEMEVQMETILETVVDKVVVLLEMLIILEVDPQIQMETH